MGIWFLRTRSGRPPGSQRVWRRGVAVAHWIQILWATTDFVETACENLNDVRSPSLAYLNWGVLYRDVGNASAMSPFLLHGIIVQFVKANMRQSTFENRKLITMQLSVGQVV